MNDIKKSDLQKGMLVEINPQEDKTRKKVVSGRLKEILTNAEYHPHGILIELESGQKGRVKALVDKGLSIDQETRVAIPSELLPLSEILENGEDHFTEFKSSSLWSQTLDKAEIIKRGISQYGQNTSKVVIAKSIAGFLNADGGDLIIGVKEIKETDEVAVIGIDSEFLKPKDKTLDGYRRMILDYILKKYFPDIVFNRINDYLRIVFEKVEGKTVCRLNISPSDRRIFLKLNNEDVFMVRIDASTRQLVGEAMMEYCDVRFK